MSCNGNIFYERATPMDVFKFVPTSTSENISNVFGNKLIMSSFSYLFLFGNINIECQLSKIDFFLCHKRLKP